MNKEHIKNMKPQFIQDLPDLNYALIGLQGSRMLGLQQSEDADYDYRGVFIAPKKDLLSLHKPSPTIEGGSSVDGEMDYVFHEVEKFFQLAIKGNPSVIELLFVPEYALITSKGHLIVNNKHLFLGEKALRSAFSGYAMSQIIYLQKNRGDAKRKAKHVRHCFRLFDQGAELLSTGHISMPLKNPEYYLRLGEMIYQEGGLENLVRIFEEKDAEFRRIKSVLPEHPDVERINQLLLHIRGEAYSWEI